MSDSVSDRLQSLASEAEGLHPWIVERRRHLHANPELSFAEEKTSAFVRDELKALGYQPAGPVAEGKYGFAVELKSPRNPDQFVLLRADMDALPIQEENDIPFRSTVPGVGHLCGHDAHTAMLLGAAKLLRDKVEELPVSVRFVFQHAEEVSPGGAVDFVREGLTKDVIGCFGLHVSPRVRSGEFGVRAGETMAAVGGFEVVMRGRGGHGAAPHEAIDPMPAVASAILALQQIVARRISPVEPAVVTVATIQGGTANNVIPDEVRFGGTFRTFNPARVLELEAMIREVCEETAKAYRCQAIVQTSHSYPPVVNDPLAIEASRRAIAEMFGADKEFPIEKSMGAEDFAYFALERPSAFVFLGCLPQGETFYPLHHCKFLPDETTLWRGSALLAAMAFVAPGVLKAGARA